VKSVHWDGGRLAQAFYKNVAAGREPLEGYEDVVVFSDMIHLTYEEVLEPYKELEILDRAYPDALFILNTRNCEDWLASRHQHPKTCERFMSVYQLDDQDAVTNLWRNEWYQHHAAVIERFGNRKGKLLIYDITRDQPEKLVAFLGHAYPGMDASAFGHHNASGRRSKAPDAVQV
jgi:hypothetical protein